MPELQVAIRYLVFAAFAASVLVAVASWLVRTRRVSPFGALGRTLRTTSEPLIRPIETRLVRAGGNPVHAGWFGYFRYSPWVRPAYVLTDWVVEPIRRVLPPAGGWDWSPLAAWLALWVLKRVLLTIVVG